MRMEGVTRAEKYIGTHAVMLLRDECQQMKVVRIIMF